MDPSDELVDIVDLDDHSIGVATRAEIRARNLRHRCAEIAVRNPAGEIYVHRRTDKKDVYPGMYDMVVGGVLASGESWDEGAARELAEETGIAGIPLRFLLDHIFDGPQEHALMRLYEVTWDGLVTPQPEEIAWGAFVSFEELDRMLAEHAFCPDSVELFGLWRDGRLEPQCHACRCLRGWLLDSLSFVDRTPLAAPRTYETGRCGLIGAWLRPH